MLHQPPSFKSIGTDFYSRSDVVTIARELLGKYLYTNLNGVLTGGMVVETEAYSGTADAACHAHLGRRTKRTQIMYGPAGIAYVYLIYGIYSLFNIVTNTEGTADAVLIRALEPTEGIPDMMTRRGLSTPETRLTAGPGLLTKALGITTGHNGTDLTDSAIWLEDHSHEIPSQAIVAGPRVGVAYAGADALLPWRFSIKENKWVSKANPKY